MLLADGMVTIHCVGDRNDERHVLVGSLEAVDGSLVMYMGRIGERSGRTKVGEEEEVRKRRWRNGRRRDGYF